MLSVENNNDDMNRAAHMTLTGRQTFAIMIAASFASTIGGLPFNSLPILLGSLADSFSLTPQETGFLGSACFAGFLMGTLTAVFIMDLISWRFLTVLSALAAASALLLSSTAPIELQMPLWAIVGFFSALMTCLGLRIMGEMPNKERALGLRQGIELGVTALVLFVLPAYVTVHYGYQGTAIALIAIILVLSLSASALPKGSSMQERQPGLREQLRLPGIAWVALIVFFIFGAGNIALWAFLERMGNSLELAPAELGTVFAVLKLLGGVAAFAIAIVGDRLGMRLPYVVVLAVVLAGLALLWKADGFISFALGAWIWEVGFTWGCVYQTATVARLDPQGRAIMLIPAAFALSSMVGPAVAGMIIADGYGPLLMLALTSTVIAVVVVGGIIAKYVRKGIPEPMEVALVADAL